MNTTVIRVLLFIIVFIFVVTLPWWFSALILISLTVYFPFYLEVMFFGFLFDALYSARYSFPNEALTIATIFLIITMFVKTQVRR